MCPPSKSNCTIPGMLSNALAIYCQKNRNKGGRGRSRTLFCLSVGRDLLILATEEAFWDVTRVQNMLEWRGGPPPSYPAINKSRLTHSKL